MLFSSPIFLFAFLPVALGLYYASPVRWRNTLLVGLSILFYLWGGGLFLLVMLGTALADYLVARRVATAVRTGADRAGKFWVATSVVANVAVLVWFKYSAFAAQGINAVLGQFGDARIPVPSVLLPLAISFFTFQRMSFTLDVSRGKVTRFPGFEDYLLFGMLFPHLIAGPIVRYLDIEGEIDHRPHRLDGFAEGVVRFGHGMVKKVLIADSVAPVADAAFANPAGPPGTAAAWLGALAYTMQLYFDFSGYSDMAIGLGRMFGFHFPENFRRPYASVSITDFWRRWHMSLSSWFRDYLYIPLGGNRGTTGRVVANLAVVFVVTGLWHGAAVTFVVWGAYHGALVILERLFGLGTTDPRAPFWPLRRAATFVLVLVGWVFFRAQGMHHSLAYLKAMVVPARAVTDPGLVFALDHRAVLVLVGAAGFSLLWPHTEPVGPWLVHAQGRLATSARLAWVAVGLPVAVAAVAVGQFSPFLYFQF